MATNNYAVSSSSRHASGTSSTSVSEREDLANFISMITRDETPFISSIGKTKATAVYHEWQADQLDSVRDSRLVDGADFTGVQPDGTNAADMESSSTFSAPNRTRFGNYTQINGKTIAVSGTKRAVDQAGVADEYAYQLKKRGTELRRDVEFHLWGNNAADAGGASAARGMGAISAWINHPTGSTALGSPTGTALFKNDAAGGVDVAAPSAANRGEGSTGITLGSGDHSDTLELSDIDQVMQNIYEAGGKATRIMVSPTNRRTISSKAQAAGATTSTGAGSVGNARRSVDDGKLRQSVDFYLSDFGEIMVEPNYIMGLLATKDLSASSAYSAMPNDYMALIYDPMWFNMASLRPMQEVDVGQAGDSTRGMIVEEQTLEVRNPIGCGAIYGLNGS